MSNISQSPNEAPIEKLRRIVQWAGWQNESYWLPVEELLTPTIPEIVQIFDACEQAGVDGPEYLPAARWPERLRPLASDDSITSEP